MWSRGVLCKCWFRALHLFLYSLAVYSPLSDSSDAALSPLVYRAPSRACARKALHTAAAKADACGYIALQHGVLRALMGKAVYLVCDASSVAVARRCPAAAAARRGE